MAKAKTARATATAGVPDLFSKAKTKVASEEKTKKSKGTVFKLPSDSPLVQGAVSDLIAATRDEKDAKAKAKLAKNQILAPATELIAQKWVELGTMPSTPLEVMNDAGEKVTYVIQDKSSQNVWTKEQHDALVELIGEDAVNKEWEEEITVFSLNPNVITQDGVAEKLNKAILAAGLTTEQAETLLIAETTRRTKGTVQERLIELVGKDVNRLLKVFEILGSQMVRYVNAS